jgi:hypothetical protein
MTGGLIDIVAYGAKDIFLTGSPEITHFKSVYRRYTNYSSESIKVNFDSHLTWDREITLTLPRVGDLVHKIFLEIELPEISFQRQLNNSNIQNALTNYQTALSNLNKVYRFMQLNYQAYRSAYQEYLVENDPSISSMQYNIFLEFGITHVGDNPVNNTNLQIINDFANLIVNQFDIGLINLNDIAQETPEATTSKDRFLNIIQNAIGKSDKVLQYYQNIVNTTYNTYQDELNSNYKFAWVDKLGHSIIDYIDVYIGADKIDRHYGEWIDIWYELSGNKKQEENYMKMIGQVPELTTFNRTTKPTYLLHIPLQFWFCRFNGLALPLVGLQYHNVMFKLKLKPMNSCAYIENTTSNDVDLDALFENNNLQLNGCMLVDYIYLDNKERRKFAQSAHEYLIEQVQYIHESSNKTDVTVNFDFSNPCKEIIWLNQKETYKQNYDGATKCQWTNYTVNNKNPTLMAKLEYNGYVRFDKLDGNYFNYVQPYYHHNNTPSNGINVYSFSLKPEEMQPSGSCNFTRITTAILYLSLDPNLVLDEDNNQIYADIHVYTVNYNILRIISGMAGLAFSQY